MRAMAKRTCFFLLGSAPSTNIPVNALTFISPCHRHFTSRLDFQEATNNLWKKCSRFSSRDTTWLSMTSRDKLPEEKDDTNVNDKIQNFDSDLDPRAVFQHVFRPWNISDLIEVEDKQLIAGDMLSLLVVAFLLGFHNAVMDPTFLPNGGFAAPIPPVPKTLGTATIRFSEIGLAWIFSSLCNRGYTYSAVESDQSALKSSIAIWVDHCSIRIVIALVIAALHHAPVDALDILKQLWFTLPLMTAFRIFYGRQNSSSSFR